MRRALTPLILLSLSLSGLACGSGSGGQETASGSGGKTGSTSAQASPAPFRLPKGNYRKADGDSDSDDQPPYARGPETDDTVLVESYGGEADQADRQAVTKAVESYYAAAAAGNGASACTLILSSLASSLAKEAGGSAASEGGGSCSENLSRMLKRQRAQFTPEDVATMVVVDVRVKGEVGLAVLGFKKAPLSDIVMEREGSAWKVAGLFAEQMT